MPFTQVDEEMRGNMHSAKRKYRKRSSVRMPEDITEEELDNVADRAKDKILDKENVSLEGNILHLLIIKIIIVVILYTYNSHSICIS